jgi:hypothetical protein
LKANQGFRTEVELQELLSRRALADGGKQGVVFQRRHVPVGGCVPDFVAVRFSALPPRDLWPRRWSFRHAHVAWLLRKWGRLTPAAIARLSYEAVISQERILRDLIRTGAVRERSDGTLSLASRLRGMRPTVVAVEAKLRRWQEALAQAKTYRQFADQVYVALDGHRSPPPETALRAFGSAQVGLLLVTRRENCWLVRLPRARPAKGPEREYLVIAAGLSQRPHTPWSRR